MDLRWSYTYANRWTAKVTVVIQKYLPKYLKRSGQTESGGEVESEHLLE